MSDDEASHITVHVKLPNSYDEDIANVKVTITSDEQGAPTRVVHRPIEYRRVPLQGQNTFWCPNRTYLPPPRPKTSPKSPSKAPLFAPKIIRPPARKATSHGIPPVVCPIAVPESQIGNKSRLVVLKIGKSLEQVCALAQRVPEGANKPNIYQIATRTTEAAHTQQSNRMQRSVRSRKNYRKAAETIDERTTFAGLIKKGTGAMNNSTPDADITPTHFETQNNALATNSQSNKLIQSIDGTVTEGVGTETSSADVRGHECAPHEVQHRQSSKNPMKRDDDVHKPDEYRSPTVRIRLISSSGSWDNSTRVKRRNLPQEFAQTRQIIQNIAKPTCPDGNKDTREEDVELSQRGSMDISDQGVMNLDDVLDVSTEYESVDESEVETEIATTNNLGDAEHKYNANKGAKNFTAQSNTEPTRPSSNSHSSLFVRRVEPPNAVLV